MTSRWGLAVVVAAIGMGCVPSAAEAGTFDVVACNSAPGYVNNSWVPLSGSGSGAWRVQCPAGAGIEASASSGSCGGASFAMARSQSFAESATCTLLPGGTARWVLTAASGTTLQSFSGTWRCSTTSSLGTWHLGSSAGGTNTGVCTSSAFTAVTRTFNAGATSLELSARFGSCHISDPGCSGHSVKAALAEARTTVRDDVLPAATTTGGTLFSGGWIRGTGTVTYDASDNTGIRRAARIIDSADRGGADHPCDYTRPAPCGSVVGATQNVDTTALSDGTHTFQMKAYDAAWNGASSASRTFKSDNAVGSVALSGALLDYDGGHVLTEPTYDLQIDATDGNGSGISQISVKVDGVSQSVLADGVQRVDPTWDCAAGGCSRSANFTMTTELFADGPRTVLVTVRDHAGNVWTRSLSVTNAQREACEIRTGSDTTYCGEVGREDETTVPADPNEPLPADVPDDYQDCLNAYPGNPGMCEPDPADADTMTASRTMASATTRRYGIADENATSYRNPAFGELEVRRVRKILPYNIMRHRDMVTGDYPRPSYMSQERYDELKRQYTDFVSLHDWTATQTPKIELMVSFERRRDLETDDGVYQMDSSGKKVVVKGRPVLLEEGNETYRPTVDSYIENIRRFRRRFGRIRLYGAWNEPNGASQPTRFGSESRVGYGPARAAVYADALRNRACKRNDDATKDCRIVAGEFLDHGKWRRYFDAYKKHLETRNYDPPYWGLHPYTDVVYSENYTRTNKPVPLSRSNSSHFNEMLPGEPIWFTEVGSRIDTKYNMAPLPAGPEDYSERLGLQNEDVDFLVNRLAENIGGGIDRLYYYNLCEPKPDQPELNPPVRRQDSGLLERADGCGAKRPAWTTFRSATMKNPNG